MRLFAFVGRLLVAVPSSGGGQPSCSLCLGDLYDRSDALSR